MRSKGEKRIANWTVSLSNWLYKSGKADPSRDLYFTGVTWALHVSQGKIAPPAEGREFDDQMAGYSDGMALLRKVVALGDAPDGEFADLLAAPYSEEVTPMRK